MPRDSIHEYLPQMKDTTAYLPGPGKYGLWLAADQDTVIDIPDTGLFVFRYRYPELYLQETGAVDMPPAYFKCDTLAEGYQEGHYADGRIMIRGNFIDGYAKDSVVSYYENGR
ncbi:MAG: hypothetical protein JST19_19185, partial [Bacteroidetes bacterium]|nr:hypothetical protein [Bacteroidota bacterium]